MLNINLIKPLKENRNGKSYQKAKTPDAVTSEVISLIPTRQSEINPMKNNIIYRDSPIIADIAITVDAKGRFNLNALHKASGLDSNKSPTLWLKTQITQDLIKELRQNPAFLQESTDMRKRTSLMIKRGINKEVFAHELLAISYAGWIGPKFQLMVNQAFLNYKKVKLAQTKTIQKYYLLEYRQAKAMELSVKLLDTVFSNLTHFSEKSKQVIYANTLNPIAGKEIIPQPPLENKTYTATEVGKRLNISANRVGRIANKLNLKTKEYGIFILEKLHSCDKYVESFRYNGKAIREINHYLDEK